MSADTSLDLSDFFNNDESDGLRLAEFLQKRRGVGQRPNYVFMNCEMQRLSLEVQLEKLPPSQLEETCKNNKERLENNKLRDANEATLVLKDIQTDKQEGKANETLSLNTKAGCNLEVPEVNIEPGMSFQPISPAINQIPDTAGNPSQRSISCRLSSIRKSGGSVSHGDRLRRYSLRQLSKQCSGKRTLLKEFESAIENTNFQPSSCSTPLSKPQPTSPAKNNSVNGSCCNHTDTLVRTLQKKDDELKKFMESMLENTLKQIQTHEKENNDCTTNDESTINSYVPKQPLNQINRIENYKNNHENLSPNRKNLKQSLRNASSLELEKPRPSLSKLMKKKRISSAQNPCSVHRLNKSSSHIDSHSNPTDSLFSVKESRSRSVLYQQETRLPILNNAGLEVQGTPAQKNVTIVLPSQNVDTPRQNVNENFLKIISDNPDALVFVPVNQTFNNICHAETVNNKSAVNGTRKQSEIQLPPLSTQLAQLTSTTNDVRYSQIAEDNLKLTDILTDDEDPMSMASTSRTVKENGQIPLNLAPSSTNIRTKCLRKRTSSRQKSQIDNFNLLSTETDTELLPQANNSRRMTRRTKLNLNRAPGIPINGEQFAQELERMSHYEILDLRKRNSLGGVFGISGNQNRFSRQEAIEKQHKLDEQIERELQKRNINEIIEKRPMQCNDANVDVENVLEVNNSPTEEELPNVPKESPLIGESPSDRVSFKTANHKELLNKTSKEQQSKVLKEYLEVSKYISKKKKHSSVNKSRRLLYTEVCTQSEATNNSTTDLDERRPSLETGEPYSATLSSPLKSDRHLKSCPPVNQQDQHTINEVEKTSHETPLAVVDINDLPPPPPGYENSLGDISYVNTIKSGKVISKTATHINTNHEDNNDEKIFKKPQQPAPKRVRKRKEESTPLNELLQLANESRQSAYSNDVSTENTLRRSRRGHMPLNNPLSAFQLFFQKTFNTGLQHRKKERKRRNLKNTLNNKSNSPKIAKARQKPKQLATVSKDCPLIAPLSQDVTIMNKKGGKIKESKALQKKMKNRKKPIQSDDNKGCSSLVLTTPPPVDHAHNVFDELRYGISTRSTQSKMTVIPSPKVKPFKVRVARLKSATCPIDCNSVNTVTCSSSGTNSNQDFISWLKNMSESNFSITQNNKIFNEIKLSPACSLSFTQLQGVEYAFYNTDEKAFLGYLRFQPRQKKPKKRSKYFNLHFISLVGDFRVTANGEDGRVGVGDMVVIKKLVYYDIENITDDIGVLMVIKNQ